MKFRPTALVLAGLTFASHVEAADQLGIRNAEELYAACSSMRGPNGGGFARLIKDCRLACRDFVNTQIQRMPAGNHLDRCRRFKRDAQKYLDGTLFEEGEDYTTLGAQQPLRAATGPIEITLFTSLVCKTCEEERESFVQWREGFSKSVSPRLMPVVWGYSKKERIDYDAYALIDVFFDSLNDEAGAARTRALVLDSRGKSPLAKKADVHDFLRKLGFDEPTLNGLNAPAIDAKLK